jgi:hypothetical protein
MEDKLGGYTVKEWRQIEDKVVDISDEVLEFVKPNIFERNAQNKEARKESVTEELYYKNEGFLNNCMVRQKLNCYFYRFSKYQEKTKETQFHFLGYRTRFSR